MCICPETQPSTITNVTLALYSFVYLDASKAFDRVNHWCLLFLKTHQSRHPYHRNLLYKAAEIFVCLSVPPPFFSTRPSDRNQIWHTYSGRYGTHSQLKKIDPAHPRGNITSYVTSSDVEYVRHLKTTARRSMT